MKRNNPTWQLLPANPELLGLLKQINFLTPVPIIFIIGEGHSLNFFATGVETEQAFNFQKEDAGIKRTFTLKGYSRELLPNGGISHHSSILKLHTKTVKGVTSFYFPVEEQDGSKKGVLLGHLGALTELPSLVEGEDLEEIPVGVGA